MTIEELWGKLEPFVSKIDDLEKKQEELDKIVNKRNLFEEEILYKECELAKFKETSGNRFACAAAQFIVNEPGSAYNPLYLYGKKGVGKTYLMHAIRNEILKRNPDNKVIYITVKQFEKQLTQETNKQNLIDEYVNMDVLLIDDIQAIEGKEYVQEVLLKIMETLLNRKRQIVIASNKSTCQMEHVNNNLKEKFEWGLIADMA